MLIVQQKNLTSLKRPSPENISRLWEKNPNSDLKKKLIISPTKALIK